MWVGFPLLIALLAVFAHHAALAQTALPTARYQPPPPTPLDMEIGQLTTGTVSLNVQETRIGGDLRGCNLVYVTAGRDFTYRQGGAVLVTGSVQIGWVPPSQLYWAIKVVPQDIVVERDGTPSRRTFTPALAWMQSGRFSTIGRIPQPFMCEGGGFCGAGTEGLIDLMEALVPGRFRLGIQRWAGGQDHIMPLDLSVASNGATTTAAFSQCMLDLFDRAGRG